MISNKSSNTIFSSTQWNRIVIFISPQTNHRKDYQVLHPLSSNKSSNKSSNTRNRTVIFTSPQANHRKDCQASHPLSSNKSSAKLNLLNSMEFQPELTSRTGKLDNGMASFQYFAYSSIIMNLTNKWRSPLDSICQIGLETIFQDILIVDGDGL
jgi:hypothetical protein